MLTGAVAHLAEASRELRLAVRRLFAAPAFALFSIATLALAIGITTAVYSVVYHFLRIDYGIDDHRSVYSLYENGFRYTTISRADYDDIVAQQQSFQSMAAWGGLWTNLSTTDAGRAGTEAGSTQIRAGAGGSPTALVRGEIVSGHYFGIVRQAAAHGRTLTPADDSPSAPPSMVLAAVTARRVFGDASVAVGRTMALAGQSFTVVGVIDDGFRGVTSDGGAFQVNVWVPLSAAPMIRGALGAAAIDFTSRDRRFLHVFGRLRGDVTVARASDELKLIGQRLNVAYPPPPTRAGLVPRSWAAGPAFRDRVGSDQSSERILVGLPLLVFLIACTNLANLSLSRGVARRHALAVRHALGATRARLVREEAGESVIIAIVGGAAGLILAEWMLQSILGFFLTRTSLAAAAFFPEVSITPAIAVMALAITLLAMVVGGLLPARSLTRRSLWESMASGNDTALPRWRGRSNLIALQVGVSVGLFLVAFSASRVLPSRLLDPGPQLDGLAAATIPFDQQGHDEPRARQLLERITGDLRRTPGISMVGVVAGLQGRDAMLLSTHRRTSVTLPERPFSELQSGTSASTITGTPEMFALLALPPIAGRVFTDDDRAGGERVIVVNDALARAVFDTPVVIGRHLQVRTSLPGRPVVESSMRIVGVVPTRGLNGRGEPSPELYLPMAQHDEPWVAILARGGEEPPIEELRRAIRAADPTLATAFIGDGAVLGGIERVMLGAATTVAHGLAAFALLLAMAGLYGVLSHVVSLRSRELAVRVALGATGRRIASMVLRDGLRPVIEGLVIALGAAMLIRKVLSVTVAKGLSSIDPAAFVIATVLLLAAGLVACVLPALRAARVDPNVVLKDG